MVVRKISEMYDMRTTLNRMGIVGIHTPSWASIDKRWHGEFLTHKFYRVLGCSVRMACASALPPDPLQIGVQDKAIAPQDIMNPILYRAVSNETWNAVIGRLYGSIASSVDVNSVRSFDDAFATLSNDEVENMYYALLSSDEWRKAMPQSGLSMRGLRPLVYPVYGVFGQGEVISQTAPQPPSSVLGSTADGASQNIAVAAANLNSDRAVRGRAVRMPRMPCTAGGIAYAGGTDVPEYLANTPVDTPRTYVCALVLPPAKLTVFYYRLIIDWYIQFSEPVSLLEKEIGKSQSADGSSTYTRSYQFSSAKDIGGVNLGSVDTVEANLDLVMEK